MDGPLYLGADGILMPTFESFLFLTKEAMRLLPQNGDTYFLPGKGWGSEIVLTGEIVGRSKQIDGLLPYRTHSDFELYATIGDPYPYTSEFRRHFGGQEFYPTTKTKGLRKLPEGLLRDTAEQATLDTGNETLKIRVPQLELLYLDKWYARESTPRSIFDNKVYDCDCVAAAYDLDRALLHTYLQAHIIEPELEAIQARQTRTNQTQRIERMLARTHEMVLAEEGRSLSNAELAAILNSKITPGILINGIIGASYDALSSDDFEQQGDAYRLTPAYCVKAEQRLTAHFDSERAQAHAKHEELDRSLDGAQLLRLRLNGAATPAPRGIQASASALREANKCVIA